jgi:hypothetical protein
MPVGTVISPTEEANKFYGDMIPHMFIHHDFSPVVIENAVKRQKIMMKTIDKHVSVYGTSNNIDPRAFLILDDCLFDSSWTKDTNVRFLFMNGRHYNMMFIITMQYPLGIPPNLRTNIDYVFILRENLVSNRKRIYENYAGMFPNFDVFCQVMDQCTENYECLVINNNAKSNKLEDQVFWYKADTHDRFRICPKDVWEVANKTKSAIHMGDSDDEGNVEPMFDLKVLQQKKNSVPISVKKGPSKAIY